MQGLNRERVAQNRLNPKMMTLAREARGHTQKSLAEALQMSQSTYSLIERGIADSPGDLSARLAQILDYPESFFFQDFELQNLPMTFHRKRVRASKRVLSKVRAELNIFRSRIGILLSEVDAESHRVPSVSGKPARIAKELRIAWHVRSGPIRDLTALVESAGVFVVHFDFGTPLIDGISIYQPDDGLPPVVFLSAEMAAVFPDRARWTLAHELGHLVMHCHQVIPTDYCEDEANTFASELLMPERDIRGQLSSEVSLRRLASLKPSWRVSMASLLYRASALGTISERKARHLWTQMNRYGYRRKEPVDIAPELPSLLHDLVSTHRDEMNRADTAIAGAIHCGPSEFRTHFRGGLYAV